MASDIGSEDLAPPLLTAASFLRPQVSKAEADDLGDSDRVKEGDRLQEQHRDRFSGSCEHKASDDQLTVTLPKPMTSGSNAEGRFGKQDFTYAT